MSTTAARFWYQRLGLLVGWFAFGWVTLILLGGLGFSLDARHLVAYLLGLGLLGIGLEMVWRRPRAAPGDGPPAPAGAGSAAASATRCSRPISCCCGRFGWPAPCRSSGSPSLSSPCRPRSA